MEIERDNNFEINLPFKGITNHRRQSFNKWSGILLTVWERRENAFITTHHLLSMWLVVAALKPFWKGGMGFITDPLRF